MYPNKYLILFNFFLIIVLIILLTILAYSNIQNIKKDIIRKFNKKHLSQLKEYTDTLETLSTDLRNFRHDYVNILTTIGGRLLNQRT